MKSRLALAVLAASLVVPAYASAHVTIKPDELPAGGYTRIDVRVPNESDEASTDQVEVQMPDGFAGASYEPVPGWETVVKTSKLDEPVETADGEITEQVDTISWTAAEGNNGIAPGPVPGLRAFGEDARQSRGDPDLPRDPDLHRRRGGPLDRRPGLRRACPDGDPRRAAPRTATPPSRQAPMKRETRRAPRWPPAAHHGRLVLGALIVAILALILSAVSLIRRR